MSSKQLIPKMLLVAGLVLTILASAPSRVLSDDPVKSKVQQQAEVVTDPSTGKVVGTVIKMGSPGGPSTWTTTYIAGPNKGTTVIDNVGSNGATISETRKSPDGTIVHDVYDDKGSRTTTTTSADGTVKTEKFIKGGGGGDVLTSASIQTTHPNGTVATQTIDPSTGKTTGLTLKDSKGNVTTTTPDGKGGFTAAFKSADGKVETITYDPSGKLTGLSLKDSKGNVTTALPDGKGGFTSAVTDKHGKVATSSYDADGKLTGETTKDKNGKVISSTSTTYDAKGGSTSVTTDKNGKVVSSTIYDKLGNVVSQTGKKQIMTLGPGGQSTGGTQTSQGSGKHKDKSIVQDSGSSGTSSGSGQQMHHKKH